MYEDRAVLGSEEDFTVPGCLWTQHALGKLWAPLVVSCLSISVMSGCGSAWQPLVMLCMILHEAELAIKGTNPLPTTALASSSLLWPWEEHRGKRQASEEKGQARSEGPLTPLLMP